MPGIGIGVSPFFNRKRGINYAAYWATLISATVENAAPTHVVLTFPTAAALDETDFTIAGFTISSASWTGTVLTLVLSSSVLYWHGNFTITFVPTSETATVTNNVAIADTVGWYASGDGSATYVTKDGSDLVSVWNDLSGANHPLNQATETNQPKWELGGILFNGSDNFIKTAAFTLNQPETIYVVLKQITWGSFNTIIDGNSTSYMRIQQYESSPKINMRASTQSASLDGLALDTLGIIRAVFNGADSSLQINNNEAITGNYGVLNGGGITVGALGEGHTEYSNIQVKELIVRNVADSVATQKTIYNFLAARHGLETIP